MANKRCVSGNFDIATTSALLNCQYLHYLYENCNRLKKIHHMNLNFSRRINDVISFSKEEAERLGNPYISPEHLLLGLLREGEGTAIEIMEQLNVDLNNLKSTIEDRLKTDTVLDNTDHIPLLKSSERVTTNFPPLHVT